MPDKEVKVVRFDDIDEETLLVLRGQVFTNGVFDLIHKGHVDYLYKASLLADKMILGLNAARELAERNNQAVFFIYKAADGEFDEYVSAKFSRYLNAN